MISTSLYPSVGTIVPYMKGNLDCLALFTTYPTRREFRCPLYRVLDTDSTTVTIVLRGALCLPLFGALSRTLSCSLSLSHSLLRSQPLWTPSMLFTCLLSFHMLLTFYHMRTIFHMLTVITCLPFITCYFIYLDYKIPAVIRRP